MTLSLYAMRGIVALIDVPEFRFEVHLKDGVPYLQGHYVEADIVSGVDEPQSTRKWLLSPHMTKSEVVQTAFKCYLTSMEHRARESFRYRGKRVYGPHFDVDALHAICTDKHLDYRRTKPETAEAQ